jgi:hypothetical protein
LVVGGTAAVVTLAADTFGIEEGGGAPSSLLRGGVKRGVGTGAPTCVGGVGNVAEERAVGRGGETLAENVLGLGERVVG